MKKLFMIFLLLIVASSLALAQKRVQDISPRLLDREIKPNYPTIDALWDVQANYDALVVTGAAGNAAAIFLPTVGEFWTSRWASALLHRWTAAGTLIEEFSVANVTGVRALTFDGTYLYAGQNTTTIAKIDPVTKTRVGTITAPQTVRYITYDPTADGGAGGFWVGNFSTNPQLISMTGAVLASLTYAGLGVTSIYGAAFDNYSVGGPYLWFWGQGAGAATPQNIVQVNPATGLPTGVQHDVITDIGIGNASAIAGGLFISTGIVPGFASIGGLLQGTPDKLFAYELTSTGPPCPVGVATDPTPADGATGISREPGNASWTNGAGTTQVEVFFGPAGSMTSIYSGAPITSIAIPGTPLSYSTTYQWKVIDKNDTCAGAPAATWSFTTLEDPNLVTVFADNFESGTGSWTITNDGGTCVWQVFTEPYPNAYTIPNSSGGVFAADVDECGSGSTINSTATLATPIDVSIYQSVMLYFDSDFNAIDADDKCYVDISIDGGTNWVNVLTYDGVDVRAMHEAINLSATAALQPSLLIRFKSIQPGWDWWWAIDNVVVIASDAIPVEFTSFIASSNESTVTLNWATATETNNRGFEVERKTTGDFQVVGFVQGNGTTTERQNYSFVDTDLNEGTYTYRLKQIDFDGRTDYSDLVEVIVSVPKVFSLEQNYPNPFNPSTKINFSLAVDAKVSLKVFDVLGQEVMTLVNGQMAAGRHDVQFNAVGLNSGVYFYRIDATGVDGNNFSSVKKMILTK
ncbi:MAG: hypothetical protein AUK34_12920 [Ignavibacteria bacterium CG2_30_36_16]|nr:MAG: hypothetical protein AUK34_12920 [Ignavibacteria bacterium CG2_30_36_16]PJB00467.1 MAG: hypothetical protein CO127_08285 [Ignavibacteria bacterium CG_4_9_14_3_um_filter_36_18]